MKFSIGRLGLVFTLAMSCASCTKAEAKSAVPFILSIEQGACVLLASELGMNEPAAVASFCQIPPGAIESIANLILSDKRSKEMAKALAAKGGKP